MKITIDREKYINHQCPAIPKSVWDIFYCDFCTATRNFVDLRNLDKIDTINIRVNQAYEGCPSFHFYVSINGMKEYHREISKHGEFPWDNKKFHPRHEWLRDLEIIYNVNVGKNNSAKRISELWNIKDEKKRTKQRVKILVHKWKTYQELREYFN